MYTETAITGLVQSILFGIMKGLEKRVFIMLRFLERMHCILLQN